jgi:hypothetical protein
MRVAVGSNGPWQAMLLAVGIALTTVPWASEAQAEPTKQELARAREDFRKGLELEAANDWAGALSTFESVAQVTMTPQVRFHIARCQHRLGKLLEALGGYRWAAHEASLDPKSATDPKLAELIREANAGVEEIEAKIPKLTIVRGTGAQAASVKLDGVALGEASVGKEMQVNPGGHTIDYALPDGRSAQKVVTLQEGDTQTVELVFAEPEKPASTASAPPPPAPPDVTQQPKSNVVPWVVLGAGGVSLAASGIFYMLRAGAISDHDKQCVNNVCPSSLKDTGDKGKTYTTLGNVTFGVGIVGVGLGAVLLLTGGSDAGGAKPAAESASKPRMTVLIGGDHHGAEANLVGTF